MERIGHFFQAVPFPARIVQTHRSSLRSFNTSPFSQDPDFALLPNRWFNSGTAASSRFPFPFA